MIILLSLIHIYKSINLLHEKTLPDIMNCLYNPKEEFEGKRLKRGLITVSYTHLVSSMKFTYLLSGYKGIKFWDVFADNVN